MDREQSLWWQNLGCSPNRWQRKARPCSKNESSAINHGWTSWQEKWGNVSRAGECWQENELNRAQKKNSFFCPHSFAIFTFA
jgi:hypothetical protein